MNDFEPVSRVKKNSVPFAPRYDVPIHFHGDTLFLKVQNAHQLCNGDGIGHGFGFTIDGYLHDIR